MGITPNTWGPYMWGAIHLICLGAPEKIDQASQVAYATFFNQLPFILPCATCARHLQDNLAKLPVEPHLGGRESMFAWSVQLHNVVNSQLGKTQMSLTDARKHWEQVCLGENKECGKKLQSKKSPNVLLMFTLGVLIGVMFMYGYTRLKKGNRRS